MVRFLGACSIVAAAGAAGSGGGGSWSTSAPYPLFVSEHNAVVVNDRIYVAGGFSGSSENFTGTTNAFHVYDPATDRWTALAPLPRKLHHFGIAALDGRIYVTGGYTDEDFDLDDKGAYVFDPAAPNGGSWSPIADLPSERAAHSSVAAGGLVYVIGGVGNDAAELLTYNPASNRWDAGRAPLPTLREHLTAAVVNNRIYVISGRWSAGNVGTVEEYDPATNRWTAKASIPTPRSGITSGVINNRIHVTAGEGHASGVTIASHEVYDPATDTWATLPSMPTGRHGLASGVVKGRWYVIGGGLLEGGGTFNSLSNRVEVFTPAMSEPNPPNAGSGRITNVSVLTTIAAAGETFSLGFVVGGAETAATKPVVIRAAGPSLSTFTNVTVLEDPRLELFSGGARAGENDNWGGSAALANAMAGVGAFPFLNAGSRDAAFSGSVGAGDHSVRISAVATGTGTVLAELYEVRVGGLVQTTPRFVNASVLKTLGAGLTLGFVVGGGTRTVLVRAIGPTLGSAPFNVAGAAADPQLVLFAGASRTAENNDWGGTAALTAAFARAGAFALPAGSRDAALLTTLSPGNYSVQVSGGGPSAGMALVEVYEVD